MHHIDVDELLKYALDIIDDSREREKIEGHLANCRECRDRLQSVHRDIGVIGGIRPRRSGVPAVTPKPGANLFHSILRAAAFILIGIGIGYGGANLSGDGPISVTRSYAEFSPPPDSLAGYAATDATHIGFRRVTEGLVPD